MANRGKQNPNDDAEVFASELKEVHALLDRVKSLDGELQRIRAESDLAIVKLRLLHRHRIPSLHLESDRRRSEFEEKLQALALRK